MAHKFFEDKRPHNGLTYDQYVANWANYLESNDVNTLSDEDKSFYNYSKLNMSRSRRIQKTFKPAGEIADLINAIKEPQIWMVITEDWCGDSAQNLPYIVKLAELNQNITLRIITRDDNLDIMDIYLTNGKSRSIPKLIAFDEKGNELFQWGPRPKEGQDNVNNWKADGLAKSEFNELLHKWYATNKGTALVAEITELLNKVVTVEA